MTETRELPYKNAAAEERDRLVVATEKYLQHFSLRLIATARAENHDLDSRSSFLIAVGATAEVKVGECYVSFSKHAINAITPHGGLLAVGAVYPEFGDWDQGQWSQTMDIAAESVILAAGQEEIARTRTLANYVALLTALHDGHASFAANG